MQEYDKPEDDAQSSSSSSSSGVKGLFCPAKKEKLKSSNSTNTSTSIDKETTSTERTSTEQGLDGAPRGFVYQADIPDEVVLVSAATLEYQYQLQGRHINDGTILFRDEASIHNRWFPA